MSSPRKSFWKSLLPLLFGVGACAACCALPLLAVGLGVGGAAATAFAAFVEPLAGVLLAVGVVTTVVLVVRRSRRQTSCSSGACAADRSCGCGPSREDTVSDAA